MTTTTAMHNPDRLERLILDLLADREMRPLAMLVALRKSVSSPVPFKGDLGRAVTAALRRLIASRAIVDNGGVFSLWPQHEHQEQD